MRRYVCFILFDIKSWCNVVLVVLIFGVYIVKRRVMGGFVHLGM